LGEAADVLVPRFFARAINAIPFQLVQMAGRILVEVVYGGCNQLSKSLLFK
jgi:hypothetical protein